MKTSRLFLAITLVLIYLTSNLYSDPGCIFKNIDSDPDAVGKYEMARMELENGIIHTVWSAKADEGTTEKIIYRQSTDGGETFEPQIDVMVPSGELESIIHGKLKMKTVGNNIYIASLCGTSIDEKHSEGLFFCKSNDGGKTFSSPDILTETKPYYGIDAIDMRIDKGNIYILSEESSSANTYGTISVFKSTDNGNTFSQIIVEEAEEIHAKELLVNNGNIHILLYKNSYYNGFVWGKLAMASSKDGGNIFTYTEISELIPGTENQRALVDYDDVTENRLMSEENGTLFVIWHELPKDGSRRLMLSKSTDNGDSFTNKGIAGYEVDEMNNFKSIFDLNIKGDNINIIQRRGSSDNISHWLTLSSDGGSNFTPLSRIDIGYSFSNRNNGAPLSAFADIKSENADGIVGIGLSPGRIRLSSDNGKTFEKGYMLIEDYSALRNYKTSKFIYTDDAIYLIGYDIGNQYVEGIDKAIRFGKIKLTDDSENPNKNLSVKINNSTPLRQGNIPESPGLHDNSPSAITVSFWYKFTCAEGEETITREIIRKHSEYQPVFNIQMIYGGIRGSIKTDKEYHLTAYKGKVVAGKWQHYTLTYDADKGDPNFKLYLDGIPVVESFTTGNIVNEIGTIFFGYNKNRKDDNYYYDDMSIWDRALAPNEIKNLALNGLSDIDQTGLLYFSDFNGTMYDADRDVSAMALTGKYSEDVPAPPFVDFNAVLNGYDLLCINKTQKAESSAWNFGDNKESDLANPLHTYKKPGEYNVVLTTGNETTIFSAFQPITVAGLAEIDKKRGTNNGNITIRLYGGGLGENDDFQLRTPSGMIIEPIMHTNPKPGVIESIFDLLDQEPAICDVVADVSGSEQVLEDAFEIIEAEPNFNYDLSVQLHGRGVAIYNMWQTYTIVLGNNSNIDAYSVPLGLAISEYPETKVEFMDFEIETPEREGYEFPDEIAEMPLYAVLDEVNGEKLHARVYPLIVPVIPANSTIRVRIRVSSPEDLELRAWLLEPIVYTIEGEGGIIKQSDKKWITGAKVDLAMCMIKVLGVGAIDVGTAAIPGVGCAWAVGKNLYNTYQTPPTSSKFKFWSFVYDWSVTVFDCGVNLSGIGNIYVAGATFYANMYGYAKSYNECLKQGVKSGAIKDVSMVWSFDPNEITGPSGYGNEGYIQPLSALPYTIYFENKADATAPAHIVTVIDTLDEMYSRKNFRFGDFGFGDQISTPSLENPNSFATDIEINDNLLLRVSGNFDTESGIITWIFQSLDPTTMDIHEDPMVGFLPPNVNSPEGEGFVSYTAFPMETPIDGEVFNNRATIIFDANESILTNTWTNTIDEIKPDSKVSLLDNISDKTFTVDWSGSDAGAGVYYYDIYVSIDGKDFIPWLIQTRETQAEFAGEKAKKYEFYSVATDKAGNVEEVPETADASTTITNVNDEISELIHLYPNPADDFVNLELKGLNGHEVMIEIFSTKAGTVYEKTIKFPGELNLLEINTTDLNSGIYFVKITTNNQIIYKNMVVLRGCK